MTKMTRRKFMKESIQSSAAVSTGLAGSSLFASCGQSNSSVGVVEAIIPLPIQVVIDDVGWWSGEDGSEYQEPYRTGISRSHVPADYQAIVDLGKALGIQPQAATVLGEWDKQNILRKVPHSTWMGDKWDNSQWVGPWLEEAADIINNNKDHFEITVHGLGHEWWVDGKFTRAEWADDNGVMRPKEILEQHLDAYAEIMHQNKLGELPKSFVPNAFRHSFGVTKGNDISLAQLLAGRGFTQINTPFSSMFNSEAAQYGFFGVDSGIMTIDRGADFLDWNIIGVIPDGEIKGPTCGMHWPNLLHKNPERNSEIVARWVKLLAPYHQKQETMLAKNSVEFQQQLAHNKLSKLKVADNAIKLDFSDTKNVGTITSNEELTVKVRSENELDFSSENIKIVSISSQKSNNSMQYTMNLEITNANGAVVTFKNKS
jgi:hypothetical protein